MGVEIKTGQGKIETSENLHEVQWKQLDRSKFLNQRDYLMFYTILTQIPDSHKRIQESKRELFIDTYLKARNNRYIFTSASSFFLFGTFGYSILSKQISIKKGLLGLIGGTIITNILNVTVFEKMYNKQFLQTMKNITTEHIDILQDPQYMYIEEDLKANIELKKAIEEQKQNLLIASRASSLEEAEQMIKENNKKNRNQMSVNSNDQQNNQDNFNVFSFGNTSDILNNNAQTQNDNVQKKL
ncbi:hypothetical protein PPERSA_10532 [Pseudocohnilembus persalinus]|uniref:Uncharacterized protein n=1 Tax=Pseudocohnilembus persalinus TaxID=266149 RepID=A0A0V0R7E9_PSEPJ|nr:hypothetical protein PPERSA_10532 [Pseudocohnilembus persalinus]|eukprot:KRX10433.1 hypothetical protein PPERSA_10532 [Pseudocohnilembus persalinus]